MAPILSSVSAKPFCPSSSYFNYYYNYHHHHHHYYPEYWIDTANRHGIPLLSSSSSPCPPNDDDDDDGGDDIRGLFFQSVAQRAFHLSRGYDRGYGVCRAIIHGKVKGSKEEEEEE